MNAVIIRHFEGKKYGNNYDAFKRSLGKSWRRLARESGYVFHGRGGGNLYVKGRFFNRELKVEMALCDDLVVHLASVQLIVILLHRTKAAIVEAGGAANIGRALLEFRQDDKMIYLTCA
jgi:hypothetical protein